MRNLLVRFLTAALVSVLVPTALASTGQAASNCAPIDLGKKAIGSVKVGSTVVDLTRVTYPAGGDLYPPDDARIAGVSSLHQPLTARLGSTLIVWHDYWNDCTGPLNVITEKKPGFRFTVTDWKGKQRAYEIVEVTTIKMGDYRSSWFSLNGPRQLVLVTCTGKLVNGHKALNAVVRAVPVIP